MRAQVGAEATPKRGRFVEAEAFDPADLPTVMRKVWTLATGRVTQGRG